MGKQARRESSSGIYHVMVRGIDRMRIFQDDEDRVRYLGTLERMKTEGQYRLYAHCLMDNHVHLLLQEGTKDLQRSMGFR